MVAASGLKGTDLVKNIIFRCTLTVQNVEVSQEKVVIEVSRLVTELRSLQRVLNDIDQESRASKAQKMSADIAKLIQKSEAAIQKLWKNGN